MFPSPLLNALAGPLKLLMVDFELVRRSVRARIRQLIHDVELARFLRLLAFWVARLCFCGIDGLAATYFSSCADACDWPDPRVNETALDDPANAHYPAVGRMTCHGLILGTATFNFFALGTFVFIVALRLRASKVDYAEAQCVTYALVLLLVLLKFADLVLPILSVVNCFPDSASPPYVNFMSMATCAHTSPPGVQVLTPNIHCRLGDFFALYAVYCGLKSGIGLLDVLSTTVLLLQAPRRWYQAEKR